jgi:hypothetical protein
MTNNRKKKKARDTQLLNEKKIEKKKHLKKFIKRLFLFNNINKSVTLLPEYPKIPVLIFRKLILQLHLDLSIFCIYYLLFIF